MSSFEPFQAVFKQIGSDFEQFQHCCGADLSGFKSEGAVKGVREGVRTFVRTGNEGVRTHQHLARIGVKTF